MKTGDLGIYTNSKIKTPVRVKVMSEPDGRGMVKVRVTSNNHPDQVKFRHGSFHRVALTSVRPKEG